MKTARSFACFVIVSLLAIPAAAQTPATPFDAAVIVKDFLALHDLGKSSVMITSWEKLPASQKLALVDELAKHLDARDKLLIFNTHDIVVRSRLITGEMTFGGHGQVTSHDFYIAGGKAAWAITRMLDAASTGILEKMPEEDRKNAILEVKMLIRIYKKGVEDGRATATTIKAPAG